MVKIDVFSGFLGAGKTTLIKKLIAEAFAGEKLVLIENEFGEIGVDAGFLEDAGIRITEMNSGCICCSLVGDFAKALNKVYKEYEPDRILIEPSGVGKLSDVIKAVLNAEVPDAVVNSATAVADAKKVAMYMKNFGEFYNDQIGTAGCIVLSRTDAMSEEKLAACLELLRSVNPTATIITTPWGELDGKTILTTMEKTDSLEAEMEKLKEEHEHHHHHHHYDENGVCSCGHHHDDDDEDEEEHEHHHHDEDEEEHEHHHHHDEDEHEHHHHHYDENGVCSCGHHHDDDDDDEDEEHEHHHHHHHHHADEIFASWGVETAKKFSTEEIDALLDALDSGKYGIVLRAKGYVADKKGGFLYFDFVPGEKNIRPGTPAVIGRLCVIGSKIDEKAIADLFTK